MEKELLRLGFSEKEAKVYAALLELGSSRVQDIAQKAGIHRTTTYVILEGLIERGLVSAFDKGKIKYFAPESPDNILRMLQTAATKIREKERATQELLPQLNQLFAVAEEKPRVRFYEGKEGIRRMWKEFWKQPANETFLALALEDYYRVFGERERDEIFAETIGKATSRKAAVRVQVLISAENPAILRPQEKTVEYRILPAAKYPFHSAIEVSGDKVLSAALRGKLVGASIESEAIADTMRTLFQLAWEAAEKNRK